MIAASALISYLSSPPKEAEPYEYKTITGLLISTPAFLNAVAISNSSALASGTSSLGEGAKSSLNIGEPACLFANSSGDKASSSPSWFPSISASLNISRSSSSVSLPLRSIAYEYCSFGPSPSP